MLLVAVGDACTRRPRRSSRGRARSSPDAVAQLDPVRRAGLAAAVACTCERAVDRQPAHHLGVDVVARRQPRLPDAVVGLVPAALDRLHHRLDHVPVLVPDRARAPWPRPRAGRRSGRRRRAGSAGWRRCRPAPAGSRRTRAACRSPPRGRARARRRCRAGAGAPDARRCARRSRRPSAGAPRPRSSEPRSTSDARGHRRVAQPAVAVVPVAHAAELLGQRGRRGGEDRARRPVAEAAQRQRAAQHLARRAMLGSRRLAAHSSHGCSARDLSLVERHPGGARRLWEPKRSSSDHRPPCGGEVDHGPRRVVAAVVERSPTRTPGA